MSILSTKSTQYLAVKHFQLEKNWILILIYVEKQKLQCTLDDLHIFFENDKSQCVKRERPLLKGHDFSEP